jgi:Protein of unknown function (DUF2808)
MFSRNSMSRKFLLPAMGIGTFVIGGALFVPSLNRPVSAMEMTQVGSSFQKAPRLSPVSATDTESSGSSTYSFRIKVPEGAGASLQAVRVSQIDGVDIISFESNQSRAYLGDRVARSQSIPLANVGGGDESSVLIPFETPVAPGHSVTITLQVQRNPTTDGIYQFGVTAFPVGDNTTGLYLGTERVQYNYSR